MAVQKEKFQYDLDYFSGSQASIFIGDVWVDDVVSMQWSLTQKKYPIYGYADQYYSAVAPGQVSVTGSFSINFKEAGYLWVILNRYMNRNITADQLLELQEENADTSDLRLKKDGASTLAAVAARENIGKLLKERVRRKIERDSKSKKDPNRFGRGEESSSDDRLLTSFAQDDANFENVAEAFEDAIWGNEAGKTQFNSKNVSFGDKIDPRIARRADQYPAFDIVISYGDFGTVQPDPKVNHTVRRIVQCHIVGTGQVIVANGEAIQEEYSFFAQNAI